MQSTAILLVSVVFYLGIIQLALGVIITDPSQIAGTSPFDYIIVGGGTAGFVVANRLTENSTIRVLVLEAGIGDEGVLEMPIPFMGPILTPETQFGWNYTVAPQIGLDNRVFSYPRGRVLGGCSAVNYLIHQFGTDEDWNRIANLTSDPNWSWTNMKQYVQKYENLVPPLDGHNTTGQFIPSLHGFSGMVAASLPALNVTIDSRVMATLGQQSEFKYNEDTVGGDQSPLGIGFIQSSTGGGVRSSSYTAYYLTAATRPNLVVLTSVMVTNIVQTGTTSAGLKAFRSVQFVQGPGFPPITINATREVILSAGSIGTPKILQLSGIGNAADLKKLNIPVLINNTDVGNNLFDHTLLPNIFVVKDANANNTFDNLLRDPNQISIQTSDWLINKTGLFVNNIANNFGFARIALNGSADPAPGPKSPHYEMIFANLFFQNPGPFRPATGGYFTIGTMLTSPVSTGTVKISSTNPFDPPIIDPRYLTNQFDIIAMRESVRAILRFTAAPAWSDWIAGRFGQAFQNATDDASIDAYVRNLTISDMHPVGTASMSIAGTSGVVDSNLLVKGADGLRIVDASVFPRSPSLHSQGPVYLLAERAADIIKAAQRSTTSSTTSLSITPTVTSSKTSFPVTSTPASPGTVPEFGQCGGIVSHPSTVLF
ncbi:Pyranose dehydrogenase 1 [Psilocybe cubensis]|uniref:Pyranose dehydrogenase 1 n=1 Tax=Psilocybe cubensis TaxID=181762 RepID=A0ACB8GLC8_PSICU|nr:Pyranose dehydrogenase 1 [Psilocybe cubensis]KAH9475864.1 Pyranose dehydrogenase 1 [Psilocybe cubensis]